MLIWFWCIYVNYISLPTIPRHVIDRLCWSRKVLERPHELINDEKSIYPADEINRCLLTPPFKFGLKHLKTVFSLFNTVIYFIR